MNCEKFLALDNQDQAQYMAELIHACQSDNQLFDWGKLIISKGKDKGLFDKVAIGAQAIAEETNNS